MDVIYGLIPSMIFIGLVLVALLFWAIKTGQFDDFEGEAHRILMDEDFTIEKDKKSNLSKKQHKQEHKLKQNETVTSINKDSI